MTWTENERRNANWARRRTRESGCRSSQPSIISRHHNPRGVDGWMDGEKDVRDGETGGQEPSKAAVKASSTDNAVTAVML
jgi:hypothetical protein